MVSAALRGGWLTLRVPEWEGAVPWWSAVLARVRRGTQYRWEAQPLCNPGSIRIRTLQAKRRVG